MVQVGFGGNNWLKNPTRFSDMVGDNGGGKVGGKGNHEVRTNKNGLLFKEGLGGE